MSTTNVMKQRVDYIRLETGLDESERKRLLNGVSRALADTYVLQLKTQNFHWNVVGPLFHSLHTLSETQYEALADAVDDLAERIRALGYPAPGSFQEFAALTSLDEWTVRKSTENMICDLVDDHETVVRGLRQAITVADQLEDHATSDLLTNQIAFHEKASWMLRAVITGTGSSDA